MPLLRLLSALAAFATIILAQDTTSPPIIPSPTTTDAAATALQTLRVPHITDLPYTPAAIYILPQTESCVAVLSLAPTNPTQAALDCSALESPVAYSVTKTRTVGVLCGPCQSLQVVGQAHGCPALTAPTATSSVEGTATAVKWKCFGSGAKRDS
jgi:hypothetical protein